VSIRTRLTAWYTSVLAVTLILFGVVVYFLLAHLMLAEVDRGLMQRAADVVHSITVITRGQSYIQQVVLPDIDVFAYPGVFVQVLDTQESIVARSANLGRYALPIQPATMSRVLRGQAVYEIATAGSQRLRLYDVPIMVKNQVVGILQVGQQLGVMDVALLRLRVILFFGSLFVIILAATGGLFLAGTALAPIKHITSIAEQIGQSGDLGQRVEYHGPKDEVGWLAATFNKMLDRLQATHVALERSMAAQMRFIADASHELRTPLTIIRGNADILARLGAARTEEEKQVLGDLIEESQRMSRLLAGLLTLARADAGQHIELGYCDLGQVVTDVSRKGAVLAANHQWQLTGVHEAWGTWVRGNGDYLQQLCLILIENAVKYTPEGQPVEFGFARQNGRARVWVRDHGPGIPEADIPHIFERFYRAPETRGLIGTGLGLAIASWIAQEHGTKIDVQSTVGVGSVFSFTLETTLPPGEENPAPSGGRNNNGADAPAGEGGF